MTEDIVQRFHRLFMEQPALLADLHGLGASVVAERLARIGAVNGIPTSAAEIRRYAAQAARRPTSRPVLADEELDALTGGSVAATEAGGLLALFTPPGPPSPFSSRHEDQP